MTRLTIPMNTGQTIRPSQRRIVLSLVLLVGASLCAWGLGRMIVYRTTLASLVPENATLIDVVGRESLQTLVDKLGDVALLPDRPVTLAMLAPYLGREAGLAILPDGQRAVFVSGSVPEDFQKQLENVGVRSSRVGSITVLYPSGANLDLLKQTSNPRLSIKSLWLGFSGWLRDGGNQEILYINQFGLGSGKRPALPLSDKAGVPSEILAFVAFDGQSSSTVDSLLTFSGLKNELMGLVQGRSGNILLTNDGQGIGYSLSVDANLETDQLAKLLQQMAYVDAPKVIETSLQDGTKVRELTAPDQDLRVGIEDQGDDTLLKVDHGDKHWRAWKRGQETVVSNREQMPTADSLIELGASFVRLANLVDIASEQSVVESTNLLILSRFKEIALFQDNFVICWQHVDN